LPWQQFRDIAKGLRLPHVESKSQQDDATYQAAPNHSFVRHPVALGRKIMLFASTK
jgi:hypothetical protein